MSYKLMKIKDVIDRQIDNRGKNPENYYELSNFPVIDNYLIKNQIYPNLEEVKRYIDKNTKDNFLRNQLKKDDVLITLVGNGIGNVTMVPKDECVIIQNTLGLRCNDAMLNKYLFYYLIYLNKIIKNLDRGSSQPSIKKTDLFELKIKVPEKQYQNKIVNLLYNLDKKIFINRKLILNLESQAQAIFKSWFVDFEPFEDGEFIESELGMIPEGWKVGCLGKSLLGKLIKSGIDKFDGEKIYLATADVTDDYITNYETRITYEDRPSRANMQPQKNTLWFAKMKNSRKLIYVGANDKYLLNKVILSTGFAGLQAYDISLSYLWTYLLSDEFNSIKDLLSSGTTMEAINNSNINKIKIIIPDEKTLIEYNNITKPMFELMSSLKIENKKLSETRYTLLPKLMSGEIRLED